MPSGKVSASSEFVGVVEVVGTDRGEDGQLEFFERLSVLDGQRNVGEFAHRANETFWYSFIDGKPQTAQNSFVRGRITVAGRFDVIGSTAV